MKRKVTFQLLMLLLMSALLLGTVGCGKKGTPGSETQPSEENSQQPGAEDLFADLPQDSYNYDYDFTVLNNISNYAITTIVPDDITSTIDSAIFSRNQYVEEALEITIKVDELGYDENKVLMERLVISDMSGENEYDICYNESWAQAILAQRGVYKSVNEYSKYLSLEKPWWYGQAMEELSVCDNIFYVVGDMQLMWYESIWCLAFNTDVLNTYNISYPYEDVENNTWTFERLYEITSATHQPGVTPNHYGIASHIAFASAMISASGIQICKQDEDDGLKIADIDTRFTDICSDIMEKFFSDNGNNCENFIRTAYDSESYTSGKFPTKETQWIWQAGNATFMGGTIGDMRLYVSGQDVPYGIVPLPKYSSEQEQYISYVYEGGALCGVPTNLGSEERLQRVCATMEWLCATSYRTVKPVYYDVILGSRIANDPTAVEMLDIIMGTTDEGITRLELDNIFRLGTASIIQRRISDNKSVASGIKSNMPLIEGNIANVLKTFKPQE